MPAAPYHGVRPWHVQPGRVRATQMSAQAVLTLREKRLNMATRHDIRNVAIVAHVDHGKTTLVDAMLKQAGAFAAHAAESLDDRMMDSNDLEREKGITILAKNTAVKYHPKDGGDVITINIIDTPGHADFGGEVERGLSMVDAVVLLVDASEGPLPQTRFVLRKALQQRLPVILCINKTDRGDSRIDEVVNETYDLFLDLDADEDQIEFPIVYACARDGVASLTKPEDGTVPADSNSLEPFFSTILSHVPAPSYDEEAPLQAHVTNLDADNFLGRIALLRVEQGELRKGQTVTWIKRDGTMANVRITELMMTEALTRKPAEVAGPGDICAVAGIPDIMIGETLADTENPIALPLITVDEPAISMTIGTNTSPLVGRGGTGKGADNKAAVKDRKVTARQVKDRLDRELVGNVSLRVLDTERPDAWEVQGRGELALAILVEQMRREGFELTIGKPQVVTKIVDGKVYEPVERMTIDVPEEHMGAVTQLMGVRKGRMDNMSNHGSGWVRMEFVVPSRGLIGFRTEFLTGTRGTGIAHSIHEGHEPWFGTLTTRNNGSLVADRSGAVTAFAMTNLQERGVLFTDPGTEVYEGMIVGENSRSDDMDVNITKEKKLTNMRSSSADSFEAIVPPRKLSLEQSLEFCRDDECVEVTPEAVRIRKVNLDARERARAASRAKHG
ncbi:GTP-binding protein [Streptomyces sp. 1222.2]|nr:GTP-binding protein [Streptomyces sp. 1222.2]